LHTAEEMAKDGFQAYWLGSERVIPDKGNLRDYWIEISSDRDFLGPAPSYVYIKDPVRRLCHRMISCSISGRGQAPKKVNDIDLFYLRSIDQGTANVPYLLAQYLFRHAEGRKSGSRLNICVRLGDTWAWVAPGPERQPTTVARAPKDAKGAHDEVEGDQAVPGPCCNKIDELVMVYYGKRRVLDSYRDSDASSTHFFSRTQIGESSRAKYQGSSLF
ncbi:hypothetical protein Tco_1495881, partial [Tanacetum coccineum]